MDLIVTTVGLLVPFFCLDIYEATFRFANDDDVSDQTILTSSLVTCIPGFLVAIMAVIVTVFIGNGSYLKLTSYIAAYVLLESITNILAQYLRGRKRMFGYAFSGVVNSIVLLASNIIFLILLKLELDGWLFSYLIAKLAAVIYLSVTSRVFRNIRVSVLDKKEIRRYLKFCLPLMPTTIMWWVMNVSDRILAGGVATGIYSAANKIPAILSVFETVFYQAWQTTAIGSLADKERDSFFSNILNKYFHFLTLGVLGLLTVGKPLMDNLFAKDYSSAWVCLCPLFLGVMIHALAGNLGSLYSVFKDTKGALYSTIAGAVTNIVLNLVFIPKFGPSGAAYTTLIGYIVTLAYRWFDVRKFVKLSFEKRKAIVYLMLLIIQALLFYYNDPVSYGIRTIICVVVIFLERKTLLRLIRR
jgi:O-antigen/teichoic acid export membrane protein